MSFLVLAGFGWFWSVHVLRWSAGRNRLRCQLSVRSNRCATSSLLPVLVLPCLRKLANLATLRSLVVLGALEAAQSALAVAYLVTTRVRRVASLSSPEAQIPTARTWHCPSGLSLGIVIAVTSSANQLPISNLRQTSLLDYHRTASRFQCS